MLLGEESRGILTISGKRRSLIAIVAAAWIVPALAIAAIIFRFGIDVPYMDDIPLGDFLARSAGPAGITWRDLMYQHTDNREFFPRLILLAFARWNHWDQRCEMFLAVLTAL